jgi:hypothetical protein
MIAIYLNKFVESVHPLMEAIQGWPIYFKKPSHQLDRDGEEMEFVKFVDARGSADDIRALGWSVAVHNDYRLHGCPYTFWLFTKGTSSVKGEGLTDADALDKIRSQLGPDGELL